MASIIKRKKNYSIVYNYTDENGETRQKWETRTSYQDALKRKAEVENQQFTGTFLPPRTSPYDAKFFLTSPAIPGILYAEQQSRKVPPASPLRPSERGLYGPAASQKRRRLLCHADTF